MVIIRGTRKFLDRVGAPREPDTTSTTLLSDWFATVMFWRPQLALFVNATTLLPVFMPLAPAATVQQRFPDTLPSSCAHTASPTTSSPTRSARPPSITSPRPTTAASSV